MNSCFVDVNKLIGKKIVRDSKDGDPQEITIS